MLQALQAFMRLNRLPKSPRSVCSTFSANQSLPGVFAKGDGKVHFLEL